MGEPSLEVRIRTLTPLWTGGIDGTMDRIHETGILGSLRWWYEAIVRGLGGYACDPTGDKKCRYDPKKNQPPEKQLCPACNVFGATGWRRRFRLEARPLEGEFDITEGMFPSGRVHSNRVGGWLLRGGYHGELELKFIGDKEVLWCEILPVLLFMEKWGALGAKTSLGYGVFQILSINGHRKEAGQCWREFLRENRNIAPFNLQQCSKQVGQWWWRRESSNDNQHQGNGNQHQGILPALTNMFFAKVRFSPKDSNWWEQFQEMKLLKQGKIPNPLPFSRLQYWEERHNIFPVAPILRSRLRYGHELPNRRSFNTICNGDGGSDWCKFVFGTVQGQSPVCGYCGTPVRPDKKDQNRWWCNTGKVSLDNSMVIRDAKRIQSKIRISWAYQINEQEWEIRLWGWLPEDQRDQHSQQRASLLRKLRSVLGVNRSNARQWHSAQNGALWSALNLMPAQVCWFERGDNDRESYLKALLEDCGQTSHGDTGNTDK